MLTKQDAEVQLMQLDVRLGKGKGAAKERARLQAIIDNPGGGTPKKKVAKQKKAPKKTPPVKKRRAKEEAETEQQFDARIKKALKLRG